MKNIVIYLGMLLLAVACKQKGNTETTTETAAVSAEDYPYTLNEPYKNWQAGDQKNAILVMKMIKAWETKNPEESASYFADTVEVTMDMFSAKMPKDSIIPFLNSSYEMYTSDLKVTMQDWESVISEDKKDQWVTLWYKQSWVDAKGIADSINIINDAKIENGKIVIFSEYVQHFPTAKK